MNIWAFSERVSRWLFSWNVLNIISGIYLSTASSPVRRGIASQNIGWGVINLVIAGAGMFFTRRRKRQLPNPNAPEVLTKETDNLRRILAINAGLDLLYIFGGSRMANTLNLQRRGMGLGIMLQGALLFVFDVMLLLLMRRQGDRLTQPGDDLPQS